MLEAYRGAFSRSRSRRRLSFEGWKDPSAEGVAEVDERLFMRNESGGICTQYVQMHAMRPAGRDYCDWVGGSPSGAHARFRNQTVRTFGIRPCAFLSFGISDTRVTLTVLFPVNQYQTPQCPAFPGM